MKWIAQDMEMFLKAREYIDTALVPLVPVSTDDDINETMEMAQVTNMLSLQLEQTFKGRVLLLPGYNYIKDQQIELTCEELKRWETALSNDGFKYIIYVTIDNDWLDMQDKLNGTILSTSYIPLHEIEEVYRQKFLEDYLKGFVEKLKNIWKGL